MRRHLVIFALALLTTVGSWTAFGFLCVAHVHAQGGAYSQSVATLTDCGSSATCAAPIQRSGSLKIAQGTIAFSSSTTAAISVIAPAFTATADYACTAMDPTHTYTWTISNTGAAAFTITAGTSNSDTWTWVCTGY